MLSRLLASFYQFALFFIYFFYFLFKGKPEWQKIENDERCTTNNCCLHNPKVQTTTLSSVISQLTENVPITDEKTDTINEKIDTIKTGVSWRRNKQTTTTTVPSTTTTTSTTSKYQIFQRMNFYQLREQYNNKGTRMLQNFCSVFCNILGYIITIIVHAIIWLCSVIYQWLFNTGSSTKISEIASESIDTQKHMEKVTDENIQEELEQRNKQQQVREQEQQQFSSINAETTTAYTFSPVEQPIIQSAEFYSRKQIYSSDFNRPTLDSPDVDGSLLSSSQSSLLLPQPPPPVPPPPTTSSPTTIPFTLPTFKIEAPATNINDGEKIPPKGGVAVLPHDIMAEAQARIKEREQKLNGQKIEQQENNEVNADWTITSKRLAPQQWKTSTPKVDENLISENKVTEDDGKFSSTRRNIVSRISQPSDPDAQFIFRVPMHQKIPSNHLPDSNFLMGRSVFSPVREAEEMRDRVNRRITETPSESFFGSRLNTPFDGRIVETPSESFLGSRLNTPFDSVTSRINTPFDVNLDSRTNSIPRYLVNRSRSQSRVHTATSPPPTHQIHPPRRDENGINIVRQRSRTVEPRLAEGTVKAFTRQWPPQSNATGIFMAKDNWNIIPTEIVSCRRVMKRSVTDKWIKRNEKGDIMDEWSTKIWEGETDELRRRNNGTGEAWHRKVEVSPDGNTSFVDNRRFYTKDYVIESETRNA